jgi:hypothetical protein
MAALPASGASRSVSCQHRSGVSGGPAEARLGTLHPHGRPGPPTITGIKPTGLPHLGNYLGMIRPALDLARTSDALCFIADYHALTTVPPPDSIRAGTLDLAATLIAFGLDPDRTEGAADRGHPAPDRARPLPARGPHGPSGGPAGDPGPRRSPGPEVRRGNAGCRSGGRRAGLGLTTSPDTAMAAERDHAARTRSPACRPASQLARRDRQ